MVENKFVVPLERNHVFKGHEMFLKSLRKMFHSQVQQRWKIALCGMEGIGKSQTALEYAYRNRDSYERIYWITANSQATLHSGYQNIAKHAGLHVLPNSSLDAVAKIVLSWLRGMDNWLIIFDNLDDISIVTRYLPKEGPRKHILITTTTRHCEAENLQLPLLDPDASVDLLLGLANISVLPNSVEQRDAYDIVKELGYHPLALEQAAAYIRESDGTLQEFKKLYDEDHRSLYRETLPGDPSVAKMWSMSCTALKKTHPFAIELMKLISFLNPDGVSVDFLVTGVQAFHGDLREIVSDPGKLVNTLLELERFSLMKWDSSAWTITIHRLLQNVVKDEMSEKFRETWVNTVVDLCDATMRLKDTTKASQFRRLCEDQIVVSLLRMKNIQTEKFANLLQRVGILHQKSGKYSESETLFSRAIEIQKSIFGEGHLETLRSMLELSKIYRLQGRLREAANLQEVVSARYRERFSEENPELLACIASLATTFYCQGRWATAANLREHVADINLRTRGVNHPDTLASLEDLATSYRDDGKLADAVKLLEDLLQKRKSNLTEDYETLTSESSLATAYAAQGRLDEAENLQKHVVEKRKQAFGKDNPHTLTSMNELAWVYRHTGRLEEASSLCREVFELRKEVLGECHPNALVSLTNLSVILYEQGDQERATAMLEDVFRQTVRILGDEHPRTQLTMAIIVLMFIGQGRMLEAIKIFWKWRGHWKRVFNLGYILKDGGISLLGHAPRLLWRGLYS